jgi:glutathione S-transferase
MSGAVLTISSKNYSSWSLRGWLLCRMAGLDFREEILSADDPSTRAELLLLSPSFLVPCLTHKGIKVWDTLAIGEYLQEVFPHAGLLPRDLAARTHCRAISGEMHSGFANLRSALPMNLKASYPGFKIWAAAQADIDRVTAIWRECLGRYGGPYLFGAKPTLADAMYAPVTTRFKTYDVKLDRQCADYCETILTLPDMIEWKDDAESERAGIEELEAEF